MKKRNKIIVVFSFLFVSTFLVAQNERLIIGRTTGQLAISSNLKIRTFGFANTLSGQVTLPGSYIDVRVGDSVNIDFWNISQGNPVSLYCKEIEFLQLNKEKELMKIKEPVHHMEHGFYSFQAKKAGTYLYYSPENYPFNLQAGMFGVIVIRPKENHATTVEPLSEVLWCSYEIDTKWHTDAIMGTEYDYTNKPIILPVYKPNYFFINGETVLKNKGLQSVTHKKEPVLLRLVNAGLYLHEIVFPSNTKLQLISGNETNIMKLSDGYKVQLQPSECIELLSSLENVGEKESIMYHFIDPISKKEYYKASIPVFY
ncbi:multicopper oxidase domain-containing protein [Flavobacterium sp. 140616W15]|uniref:multicopper oxidase domain-containing protein n=1 Tax=Flavobacterium sp. 140616W15 TaxID=2478552 RepID=UPI001F5D5407|nr:multicopper oxidase domain-containing protein [Flavobacterium sp. 140616W15]